MIIVKSAVMLKVPANAAFSDWIFSVMTETILKKNILTTRLAKSITERRRSEESISLDILRSVDEPCRMVLRSSASKEKKAASEAEKKAESDISPPRIGIQGKI